MRYRGAGWWCIPVGPSSPPAGKETCLRKWCFCYIVGTCHKSVLIHAQPPWAIYLRVLTMVDTEGGGALQYMLRGQLSTMLNSKMRVIQLFSKSHLNLSWAKLHKKLKSTQNWRIFTWYYFSELSGMGQKSDPWFLSKHTTLRPFRPPSQILFPRPCFLSCSATEEEEAERKRTRPFRLKSQMKI